MPSSNKLHHKKLATKGEKLTSPSFPPLLSSLFIPPIPSAISPATFTLRVVPRRTAVVGGHHRGQAVPLRTGMMAAACPAARGQRSAADSRERLGDTRQASRRNAVPLAPAGGWRRGRDDDHCQRAGLAIGFLRREHHRRGGRSDGLWCVRCCCCCCLLKGRPRERDKIQRTECPWGRSALAEWWVVLKTGRSERGARAAPFEGGSLLRAAYPEVGCEREREHERRWRPGRRRASEARYMRQAPAPHHPRSPPTRTAEAGWQSLPPRQCLGGGAE